MKKLKNILKEVIKEKQAVRTKSGEVVDLHDFSQFEEYIVDLLRDNDDFVFAHFGSVPKLGIYPGSKYSTPIGIYSYPVAEMDLERLFFGDVPFAGGHENIMIFTIPESVRKNVLIVDEDGEVDDESGVTRRQIDEAKEDVIDETIKENELTQEETDSLIDYIENASKQGSVGKFWNATRYLSDTKGSFISSFATTYQSVAKPNPIEWNKILINHGIRGVIDKGSGTIHENEPKQAVFFRTGDLKLIVNLKKPNKEQKKVMRFDMSVMRNLLRRIYSQSIRVDVPESDWKFFYDTVSKVVRDIDPNLHPGFDSIAKFSEEEKKILKDTLERFRRSDSFKRELTRLKGIKIKPNEVRNALQKFLNFL